MISKSKGEVKVKTLEVLDKVLRGKRIKEATERHYREALKSLSGYSEERLVARVIELATQYG